MPSGIKLSEAAPVEQAVPVELMAARIDATLKHDRLDHLPRMTAPTMVLVADDDTLVPPYFDATIASTIPGARLVRMPEGGHNCFRKDPAGSTGSSSSFWQVLRSPHPDAVAPGRQSAF